MYEWKNEIYELEQLKEKYSDSKFFCGICDERIKRIREKNDFHRTTKSGRGSVMKGIRQILENMIVEFLRGKGASVVIDNAERQINSIILANGFPEKDKRKIKNG